MGGNVQPQFTRQSNFLSTEFGGTALTTSDGSGGTFGTSMIIIFTADATNGSYVEAVRILAVASVASTATAATTARLYVATTNSGSTSTANCGLIIEVALPIITANVSGTATNVYDIPLGIRINAGTYLAISSHVVNNANTSLRATVFGNDY